MLAGSLDEDPERERELAATLFARRVDGLIVVPAGRDQSYLRDEQEMSAALEFVDRPPALLPAGSVTADNRAGAAAGVRHLTRQHVLPTRLIERGSGEIPVPDS